MRFRRIHLWLLSAWIVVSLLRELTDLFGRLWLLVLADFFQIVVCTIGVFSVMESRRSLLAVHIAGSFVLLILNSLLATCWLHNSSHRCVTLLSLGIPYSFSFWLRYTPQCRSQFDPLIGRYTQDKCWIGFEYIEGSISIIHATLAVLTILFSLANMCSKKKKSLPLPIPDLHERSVTQHSTSSSANEKRGMTMTSSHGGYANVMYKDTRRTHSSYTDREPSTRPSSSEQSEISKEDETKLYAEMNKKTNDKNTGNMKGTGGRRFVRGGNEQRRSERYSQYSTIDPSERKETKTTSLISFDPKSPTPIQVHEMEDNQSILSEDSIDDTVVRGPSRAELARLSQRVWGGEDTARVYGREHTELPPSILGRRDESSMDSAYEGSTRMRHKSGERWSPDGGLPLATSAYPPGSRRNSAFQIRPEGGALVGGHYHSIEELQLVQQTGEVALIKGEALLV